MGIQHEIPDEEIVCVNTLAEAEPYMNSETLPRLVICDVHIAGESSFDTAVRFCRRSCPVIFFTASQAAPHILEAKNMGAAGYILKTDSPDHLFNLIRSADSQQQFVLSPGAENRAEMENPDIHRMENLTPRELQIFRLLTEGKNYREIGELLFISPKTVNVHRRNIYSKLGAHNFSDLFKIALSTGTIEEPKE